MTRQEILIKLSELEAKRKRFVAIKQELENKYFEKAVINVGIHTTNYNYRDNSGGFSNTVDRILFLDYVCKEAEKLEKEIQKYILELNASHKK